MTYMKKTYLINLLEKLEQPYMVFDNKLFIIPTSSPMFELLPGQVTRHIEFDHPSLICGNYTFLILDLNTYKIDPVKDTYEYIKENEDKI